MFLHRASALSYILLELYGERINLIRRTQEAKPHLLKVSDVPHTIKPFGAGAIWQMFSWYKRRDHSLAVVHNDSWRPFDAFIDSTISLSLQCKKRLPRSNQQILWAFCPIPKIQLHRLQWLLESSWRIYRSCYLNSQCKITLIPRPNQQIPWAFRPHTENATLHGPFIIALFQAPPFKEFQQVLAFLSSIGLATAASCAFSLVGITSSFGDSGDAAKAQIKKSALFLSWASACFIVSIGFVAATQILYTGTAIQVLGMKGTRPEKVLRMGLACFAWTALGFQTAAAVLSGQSLRVFAHGPVYLANFGLVASAVLVMLVGFVSMTAVPEGRKKLSILWTLGGLFPQFG